MALGDVYEVQIAMNGPDGELFINVLHIIQATGSFDITPGDLQILATELETYYATVIDSVLSTTATWGELVVQVLTGPSAGLVASSSAYGGTAGASLGAVGPIERAICMRKTTGHTGRRNRGRNFIPMPCREAFTPSGSYDPTNPDNAAIFALAAAMLATITSATVGGGSTFTLVIWHRTTLTYSVVTAVVPSALVGVQRRRRIGVGV